MKFIKLTKGLQAIIDDEDYEWLSQWKWYTHKNKRSKTYYARRSKDDVFMHRLLLGLTDRKRFSDHKDGNGLNNQKDNLREASYSQNNANVDSHLDSLSKFKGVCLNRGKYWQAQITVNKKRIHLGNFKDELGAAEAYNRAALKAFGEFAKLNKVA